MTLKRRIPSDSSEVKVICIKYQKELLEDEVFTIHQPDLPDNQKMENETKDRYNAVFILFYVLGTIATVPHNFFITASNYWTYKFRDPTGEVPKTQMQAEFFSTFSTVSTYTTMAILGVAIFFANRVSVHIRMLSSMSTMMIIFTITLVLTEINTDSWQKEFYIISMVLGGLLNAAGACFYVPIFQIASKFPPVYLAAQMTGSSLCGTLSSIVQILAISLTSSASGSGFLYFAAGGVIVLSAIALYLGVAMKSRYFKEKTKEEKNPVIEEADKEAFSKELVFRIFKKNGTVLLSMVSVMGTSAMIHPGVTSLISPTTTGNEWTDKYFVPVCCYFLYNFCELIGKELVRRYSIKLKPGCLLAMAVTRMLTIVPLILFCNIQPRHNLPVLLNSDYAYIGLIILLALTSGYMTNLCIFSLPSLADPKEMKIAFVFILTFMVVAMASFSFVSVVFVKII